MHLLYFDQKLNKKFHKSYYKIEYLKLFQILIRHEKKKKTASISPLNYFTVRVWAQHRYLQMEHLFLILFNSNTITFAPSQRN